MGHRHHGTSHSGRQGATVLWCWMCSAAGWWAGRSTIRPLRVWSPKPGMAIENRKPHQGTVIHSDQGTQFASWAFTQRAHQSGLVPSMGTVGDCFDNALMESFWARMQVELLDRRRWRTRIELANAIFEYLAIFHNRQRTPHSTRHAHPDRIRKTPTTTTEASHH